LLNQLRDIRPEVEIETIEVLKNPGRVLREGVFSIPVLLINKKRWYRLPSLQDIIDELDNTTRF
jgi:hypothetical protein